MFSFSYFIEILPKIAEKLGVTLQLTVTAGFFSLCIGVIVAVIGYYKIKILYPISRLYLSVLRGTPLVAQLYFFYYRSTPNLKLKRLKELKENLEIPLVIHGSSFLSDAQLRSLIENGATKINIASELNRACQTVGCDVSIGDFYDRLRRERAAVREVASDKILALRGEM